MKIRAINGARVRRSAGASPTTPAGILGGACIFDFQRGVGITASGGEVTQWDDRTGAHSALNTSGLGTAPTDHTDGPEGNGTTEFLSIADAAAFDVTTAAVFGIKIIPDVITGNHVPLARGTSTGGTWSFQSNAAAMRFHVGVPGVSFGQGGSMVAGTPTYFLVIFDGSGGSSATRLIMRQDGVSVALSFPTGAIPSSIGASADAIAMLEYTNGVQFFDGHIQAAFFGSVVPSAGQITALETYLAGA